jgi:hypothetical protein
MTAAEIIDGLGGTKGVQALTGLSKARVSQWRTEDRIPRPWLLYLREVRPDVFAEKEPADSAPR